MKRILIIGLCLSLFACATTGTQQTIPTGCESAIVYTRLPGFMPNGPMLTRVAVAAAIATAATAGHPEVRWLVAWAMPVLFKATLSGGLAGGMAEVQTKFDLGKVGGYITPLLILFEDLTKAGVGTQVGLTECDRNVLASLFKNIGLDAGAKVEEF